ncbi:MAG TPA: hypothetical protein VFS37_00815, partial [Conexibacter sp.]|nr:hypothetical protein [Conexibacter sp.]
MSALRAIMQAHLARLAFLALAVAALLAGGSGMALADQGWEIVSISNTTVRAGDELTYSIEVFDRTEAPSDGTPITVVLTLPPGMTGVSFEDVFAGFDCGSVTGLSVITCTSNGTASPDQRMRLLVTAAVDPGASGVKTAALDVSGGGLASASTADPVTISPVPPPFGIDAFDGRVGDSAGAAFTQAGGHPASLSTALDFNTATDTSPTPNPFQPIIGPNQPIEPVKDIIVDLPPGLVGNPSAADECTSGQLANAEVVTPRPLCPATSQVGTAEILENGSKLGNVLGPFPIFNMVPPPGVPARFGINVIGTIVVLDASVRTGSDYGLTVTSRNASAGVALVGAHLEFWGVPADPSHDLERSCPGQKAPGDTGGGDPPCRSGAGLRPFFRLPTSCTAPGVGLTTTVRVASWFHPGDFKAASFESHVPPGYPFNPDDPSTPWGLPIGPNGCDRVPFDPTLNAQPLAGTRAAGPSAFAFDITIPQDDNSDTVGQSDLRKAVVTLPAGVRVNPSSADGLGACTSAQIALRSDAAPSCPDNSKIGTVTIDTPLLDVPVTGGVYLATPFDNPFNSLVAIYIVASAKGVVIKLPGEVSLDARTRQITTTFDNNPQLPFSRLHLEFKSGPRAPMALPNRCGTYTTHAVLTGWNGRVVEQDSSFSLAENAKGRPCPPEFSPGFSAGTVSNSAGSSSSFLMRFTRGDEDQELSGLTVELPRGLTGRIARAELCSDAQAGADACPAGSRIGDVTVGAGAGSNPFFIESGKAYLTGPYNGAPFGVAIVVPAVAGPFDLGKVTVRSALFVDKHDATVRIVSDPFPTILQGIPLDVRDVRVDVNKPGFFLNPTSCAEKRITGTLTSTEGAKANVSDRFQAAECASLGFKPRMVMRVGGRGHTRAGQTSPFTTRLTMPQRNQSNVRFVRVTLPRTINARLNTINDACTRAEFESDIRKCAHAKAGSAVASTPLLRRPLRGSVFFVRNGNPIPDLFVALRGQVDFDLVGRISIVNNTLLRTTFAT